MCQAGPFENMRFGVVENGDFYLVFLLYIDIKYLQRLEKVRVAKGKYKWHLDFVPAERLDDEDRLDMEVLQHRIINPCF